MLPLILLLVASVTSFALTALDKYVAEPDPLSSYVFLKTQHFGMADVHWLNLTSQRWLNESFVSPSIWTHFLAVVVPIEGPNHHRLRPPNSGVDTAVLYIAGGRTGQMPAVNDKELLFGINVCTESGASLCAILFQIPNEPLIFHQQKPIPKPLSEDPAIAWTWWHFCVDPDFPQVLLRFPMVKAGVVAMRAVEDYSQKAIGKKIAQWAVMGASKRGWTAWLVGAIEAAANQNFAIDDRKNGPFPTGPSPAPVVAVVPLVMSFVHMTQQMKNWFRMLNGWSVVLVDYYNLNITAYVGTDIISKMAVQIDPYLYRDRYEGMVLYEVMSSDDEFFTLLDPRIYWDEMKFSEKKLMVIPNAEHSLISGTPELLPSLSSFIGSVVQSSDDVPLRPDIRWELDQNATTIRLYSSVQADSAKVWHTRSVVPIGDRMDFRCMSNDNPCPSHLVLGGYCIQPILWFDKKIEGKQEGSEWAYSAHFTEEEGYGKYLAFFIEVKFDVPSLADPLFFTSEGMIVPGEYPYPDCGSGASCRGKLR